MMKIKTLEEKIQQESQDIKIDKSVRYVRYDLKKELEQIFKEEEKKSYTLKLKNY